MTKCGHRVAVLTASLTLAVTAVGADVTTYRYLDEATGFTLEVPKDWERRDPEAMTQALVETNTQFWGRRSTGAQLAQVLLVALPPHDGPANARPAVICSSAPTPLGLKTAPSEAEQHLREAVSSTFGRAGAIVSAPRQISAGGQEAYRITAIEKTGPSAEFFGAIKEGIFIQCAGMYDEASREEIGAALDSIRFEKVATADPSKQEAIRARIDPEALRAVFMKVGCGAPSSDLFYYARQRDQGVAKADVPPSPFIGTHAVRLSAAEIDIYHSALVEDAYEGAGLSANDFLLYGHRKCGAAIEGRPTGSIVVYQEKLDACVAKKKDRLACSAKLLKW